MNASSGTMGGHRVEVSPRSQQILARSGGARVTDMLIRQAAARPDEIAVIASDGQLTYRELEQAARGLARHLRRLGVTPDDFVGLYTEPSLDEIISVWGVLFAGAAYMPLSPEYPQDRLRYMIEDSGSQILIAQEHLASRLADLAPRDRQIVTLADAAPTVGDILPRPEAQADSTPRPEAQADSTPRPEAQADSTPPARLDSLAYVIYTSGSTGKPKGVMIEHGGIAAQMRWIHDVARVDHSATVLHKTPMSFDAAQWEILASAVGAKLVVGAPGIYRDVEALTAAVMEHRVTILQCVPTLLQALTDSDDFAKCTTLTRVFSGGEALTRKLARAVRKTLPSAQLINLYGPTECTINSTAMLIAPDEDEGDDDTGTVPIGVPVDNTCCFILDGNMAPVGIGETGELYIGGVQLARGYLNRPDQTRERFVASPFVPTQRLFKTGDLAYWNPDGTIQFVGRTDNQVKVDGYRIELDEIAVSIAAHPWVKRAAALVRPGPRDQRPALVAAIELNPKEAALMDQGLDEAHHRSKASRLQVRAQLSGGGLRDDLRGKHQIELPGAEENTHQRRAAFDRKTYRFFDGGQVATADLARLLAPPELPRLRRDPDDVGLAELGEILRWFGPFRSDERLLPKFTYASPGALYATQLYLETAGREGLARGVYYYHPVDHALYWITDSWTSTPSLQVHFVGKRSAIEPVYQRNISEVLEMEAGHMLGVFDEVLPQHGLAINPLPFRPGVRYRLDIAPEDYYLGSFALDPNETPIQHDPTEIYVQTHADRVDGLPAGTYRYADGRFEWISDDMVQRRHVIAINQRVYDRASFGITVVNRSQPDWLQYISLGRKLHQLQRNNLRIGLMSAGYSSKTGFPLPAAVRMNEIFAARGIQPGSVYFALGGRISAEQLSSEGMYEDSVHTQGPAELIKEELARSLPRYMLPSKIVILDRLPLTANGKVDTKALADRPELAEAAAPPRVEPATDSERWLARQWAELLKSDDVSTEDDFFASGGNSLIAVALVNRINRQFGVRLPLQALFESSKLVDLAARIAAPAEGASSRLVRLAGPETGTGLPPVFCWPGLGGYPMNLRHLGQALDTKRQFFGVQAHGLNAGESVYPTIGEMAAADIEEIKRVQPEGPYTLYGYSFGARVAFEAARQLEQAGDRVGQLLLLCPGNPKIAQEVPAPSRTAAYDNPVYVTILFSVFTGTISGPDLDLCLRTVRDEPAFISFIHARYPSLDEGLMARIIRLISRTFEFEYQFKELTGRQLRAPIGIIKASGDDYSFLDGVTGYSAAPPVVVQLAGDHYGVLRQPGVSELAEAIQSLCQELDREVSQPGEAA